MSGSANKASSSRLIPLGRRTSFGSNQHVLPPYTFNFSQTSTAEAASAQSSIYGTFGNGV